MKKWNNNCDYLNFKLEVRVSWKSISISVSLIGLVILFLWCRKQGKQLNRAHGIALYFDTMIITLLPCNSRSCKVAKKGLRVAERAIIAEGIENIRKILIRFAIVELRANSQLIDLFSYCSTFANFCIQFIHLLLSKRSISTYLCLHNFFTKENN